VNSSEADVNAFSPTFKYQLWFNMGTPSTPASAELAVVGVLTVSDRAFRGEYEDLGGPAVCSYVRSHFAGPPTLVCRVVADERVDISRALRELADACDLVLTTGGTGPAPRDVTPEATADACDKLIPGFGERMRAVSVDAVPTAILSRQSAGVCGTTLVVNLPGSVKAIPECLDAVLVAIPHAVRLVGARRALKLLPKYHVPGAFCKECNATH
jgi:molybdopterin adenylyltransferase